MGSHNQPRITLRVSLTHVVKRVVKHGEGYYSGRCRACNEEGRIEGEGLPGYMRGNCEDGLLVHKRNCQMNEYLLSDGRIKEQYR